MAAHVNLEDRILFVDGEAIVIDKPEGLPVDAPRAGGDSIEARIDELKLGFKRPPVPMHRLDRDTSGCLLLARNPRPDRATIKNWLGANICRCTGYRMIFEAVEDAAERLARKGGVR